MIKVLFICHGNICRSPMAEFMFKKLVKEKGMESEFHIESCATSTEEIGNPVYPPAKRKLREYGMSCEGKTARQFKKSEYKDWDYILCMDQYNVRNLIRMVGNDSAEKISKLLTWCGEGRDVADPWYTGDFQTTYEDIQRGIEAFYQRIVEEGCKHE